MNGKTLWPGENLDPSSLLVLGLGAVAGPDAVFRATLLGFADKLMKTANIHTQRVTPLMLALAHLSTPESDVIDYLSRLAQHSDQTLSYNAILGLGLVASGSGHNRAAQALRYAIQARFFSATETSPLQATVAAVQIAMGLLFAGKGVVQAQKLTKVQTGALLAAVFFIAPAADVQLRTKIQPINFLFGLVLQEKLCRGVSGDAENFLDEVQFEVRTGKQVEDILGEAPTRLAGFSLSRSPAVVAAAEMAIIASGTSGDTATSAGVPAWTWTNGLVVRPGTLVLNQVGKTAAVEKGGKELKKDGIYE